MNKKNTTEKIVIAAMLASLTCVATMIIKIPSPMKGYLNLGDCIVLMCGWMLSPMYGFLAAGFGSALADLFSGFPVYIPATFLIKGLMALAAYYLAIHKKEAGHTARQIGFIVSGFLAEVIMVAGYFLFESMLYGFIPSLANVPANAMQGVAGLVLGIILINILNKSNRI